MKGTMNMAAALAGLMVLAGTALPAETAPPALSGRYRNVLQGFSLCPPAGTERIRQTSLRRLVAWVKRDPATRAVRWSLEVLRTRQRPTKLPLEQYAQAVARELARKSRFKVESVRLGVVAGRPAMNFRGMRGGELRLWCRQCWVQVRPNEYLVLHIAGAEGYKAEMDAVLTAVAKTLELFDPAQARKERAEGLRRGQKLLQGLTDSRLRALLPGRVLYFTLRLKDKPVGFIRLTMQIARPHGQAGLRAVRWGALRMPGQPRRLICEHLFATADGQFERWNSIVVSGEGQTATRVLQEAIKQDELLLVQTRSAGGPWKTRQYRIPKVIRGAYLPQATALVITQLIDRSQPGCYGFAVFNPAGGGFDLRTIRVLGPAKVTLAGNTVAGTHLKDQKADDAPLADVWVDAAGRLIRMRTAEGLVIDRAEADAVVKPFAAELVELQKLSERLARRQAERH